jgi:hypothetical protein
MNNIVIIVLVLIVIIVILLILNNSSNFSNNSNFSNTEITGNTGDSFLFVTYDNDITNKHLKNLLKQVNMLGYPNCIVLGEGEKWDGWYGRTIAYQKYIQTVNPEFYILLTDGRDVVLNDYYSSFIEKAKKMYDGRLIVGVEPSCCVTNYSKNSRSNNIDDSAFGYINTIYKPFMEKIAEERGIKTQYKYLNYGLQFGKAKDFLNLFNLMNIGPEEDDQVLLFKIFYDNPNLINPDYNQEILSNAHGSHYLTCKYVFDETLNFFKNTITDTQPCVIQLPSKNWHCYEYLLNKLLINPEYTSRNILDKLYSFYMNFFLK